ncbi:MAG: hypothetical protein KF784_11470 [Fimbriimonadaceae bacterium]|nr:hypothetical protein [Fimbriimonadaceae bacterium]
MVFRSILIATSLLAGALFAQAQSKTYGKTNAQILSMGRSKWFDFYTSKAGQSTLDMSNAERLYGAALKERNDQRLAKESKTRKEAIAAIRKSADAFGYGMISVGIAYSGGGTIWNPVIAGVSADTEEALYDVLFKKPLSKENRKALSFATLQKEVEQIGSRLAKDQKRIAEYDTPDGTYYSDAVKAQRDCVALLKTITASVAKLRTNERTRIAALLKKFIDMRAGMS